MKKSRPVFEKNFFQKMEVNLNFRGLGEISTCQNFKKIQASSTLCVVQIWWRCDFEHIPLFAKNRFSHRPQWKRRLITCPLSAGKTLTTESVDVASYTPQHAITLHVNNNVTTVYAPENGISANQWPKYIMLKFRCSQEICLMLNGH